MAKYTDEDIRGMQKITIKIAADYLGISPNMLTLGMRNNLICCIIKLDKVATKIPHFCK
jgi:hypothetical protein